MSLTILMLAGVLVLASAAGAWPRAQEPAPAGNVIFFDGFNGHSVNRDASNVIVTGRVGREKASASGVTITFEDRAP